MKKQARGRESTLAAMREKIKKHKLQLASLDTNLNKMNKAKQSAQKESLQKQLAKLQASEGKLLAQKATRSASLKALEESHKLLQKQIAANKAAERANTLKAKTLRGDLAAVHKQLSVQEQHLQRVENAALTNTRVQDAALGKIRDQFKSQSGALKGKVFAMKKALARKLSKLKALGAVEAEQSVKEAKTTAKLTALSFQIKEKAKQNAKIASASNEDNRNAHSKLMSLETKYSQGTSDEQVEKSKVSLEMKKIQAVRLAQEGAMAKAEEVRQAALSREKKEAQSVDQYNAQQTILKDNLAKAEFRVKALVKNVAHLKIMSDPKRTKFLEAELAATLKEKAAAKAALDKTTDLVSKVKAKVEAKQAEDIRLKTNTLPKSDGKKTAEMGALQLAEEEKKDAKEQVVLAMDNHKLAAKRFSKLAPDVTALQKQSIKVKQALDKAENDIISVQTTNKLSGKAEIGPLKEELKARVISASKAEENTKVLATAYAKLQASIKSVKRRLARHALFMSKQTEKQGSVADKETTKVKEMSKELQIAKAHLMHSKQSLDMFLNKAQADAAKSVKNHAAGEKALQAKLLQAKAAAREAYSGEEDVKVQVAAHMARTVGRERKLQELRRSGLTKMRAYAAKVLDHLKGLLSGDKVKDAKALQEITELQGQIKTQQSTDAKILAEKEAKEKEIAALEQKVVDTVSKEKESAKDAVAKVLKTDEAAADDAKEKEKNNKAKLEIAALAQQIKIATAKLNNANSNKAETKEAVQAMKDKLAGLKKSLKKESSALQKAEHKAKDASAATAAIEKKVADFKEKHKEAKKALAKAKVGGKAAISELYEMEAAVKKHEAKIAAVKESLDSAKKSEEAATKALKAAKEKEAADAVKLTNDNMTQTEAEQQAKLLNMKLLNAKASLAATKAKAIETSTALKKDEESLAKATTLASQLQKTATKNAKKLSKLSASEVAKRKEAIDVSAKAKEVAAGLKKTTAKEKTVELDASTASKAEALKTKQISELESKVQKEEAAASVKKVEGESTEVGKTKADADKVKAKLASVEAKIKKETVSLEKDTSTTSAAKAKISQDKNTFNTEKLNAGQEKKALSTEAKVEKAAVAGAVAKEAKLQGDVKNLEKWKGKLKADIVKYGLFVVKHKSEADSKEAELASETAKAKIMRSDVGKTTTKLASVEAEEAAAAAKLKATKAKTERLVSQSAKISTSSTLSEMAVLDKETTAKLSQEDALKAAVDKANKKLQAEVTNSATSSAAEEDAKAALEKKKTEHAEAIASLKVMATAAKNQLAVRAAELTEARVTKNKALAKQATLRQMHNNKQIELADSSKTLRHMKDSLLRAKKALEREQERTRALSTKVSLDKAESTEYNRHAVKLKSEVANSAVEIKKLHDAKVKAIEVIKTKILKAAKKQVALKASVLEVKQQVIATEAKLRSTRAGIDAKKDAAARTKNVIAKLEKKIRVQKAFLGGPLLAAGNSGE